MAIKMVSKVDTFCIFVLFAVALEATEAIRSEYLPDGGAVPSREVCRRRGSHIHDWRSARQPISPSIGD
jgi:hypothetical protein